ncbi:hypothetical protein G7046_g8113 [Stylonectria norvegica]|nr:hypothetical protein G7046_g8113 [Stylonectria norvegica]
MFTPRTICSTDGLRAFTGFAILGLVNTILPFIIFSANSLTTPYPRWAILLIELLPALATKLLLPHVLHRVPYWMRPLTVASFWILGAVITPATPSPSLRILTSLIASASAAATDVSLLGMMRYYGRLGLAGWGAGTGAGAVVCAALPFVLTVWKDAFLGISVHCVYCLTGAMLVASFAVLPRAPMNYPETWQGDDKGALEDSEQGVALLMPDYLEELNRQLSSSTRMKLVGKMLRPFMLPLFVAFAAQAIVLPGITRALPISPSFETFFAFATSSGLAFQLGSFISRTTVLVFRPRNIARPLVLLLATTAMLLLAAYSPVSSSMLVGVIAFCAGLMGGAVYMTVFATIVEEKTSELGTTKEFCLQVTGEGETAGLFVASTAIMMKPHREDDSSVQ